MRRFWISALGVPIVAAATLLMLAEPSMAQRRGGGRGSSWSGGGWNGSRSSWGVGIGPGGVGVYSGQGGWGGYSGYGYGAYPGYYSRGFYYGGRPGFYGGNYYDNYYPDNYYYSTPPNYGDTGAAAPAYGYDEAYRSEAADDSRVARLTIRVPDPNAEVFISGVRATQNGTVREFVSPPISSDGEYVYHVRARWMANGRQFDQTKDVDVQPGARVNVDFTREMATDRDRGTDQNRDDGRNRDDERRAPPRQGDYNR
jgi:uncharacterized protein (TIGR03000 family)